MRRTSQPDGMRARRNEGTSGPSSHDTMVCVVTRVHLKHAVSLVPMFLAYRRLRAQARIGEGLLHSAFAIEGAHTFFTISVWSSDVAIHRFGADVLGHIGAVRSAHRRSQKNSDGRPEIWSTRWVSPVSTNSQLRWSEPAEEDGQPADSARGYGGGVSAEASPGAQEPR
jgi:hypothetical protein